jgi:hypothetical protein
VGKLLWALALMSALTLTLCPSPGSARMGAVFKRRDRMQDKELRPTEIGT